MSAFFANGPRYNLLNSAVLELVEFVRRENVKPLVAHLAEHFSDRFADVNYVSTFKLLLQRHEQVWGPGGGARGLAGWLGRGLRHTLAA